MRPPAFWIAVQSKSGVPAANATSIIEQTDHSSITHPVMTRGLPDPLPELRMRRNATRNSSTGSMTLITPNTPAASA